jgi:hypothetical protein
MRLLPRLQEFAPHAVGETPAVEPFRRRASAKACAAKKKAALLMKSDPELFRRQVCCLGGRKVLKSIRHSLSLWHRFRG